MDFKAITLFHHGHPCREGGSRNTIATLESDHIKPVNSFASYAQFNYLFNLQT